MPSLTGWYAVSYSYVLNRHDPTVGHDGCVADEAVPDLLFDAGSVPNAEASDAADREPDPQVPAAVEQRQTA